MKTPEEMAEEYLDQDKVASTAINRDAEDLVKDAFIAGYKAAQQQPVTKKVTDDYIETASNEAKELIAEFGFKGDEEVLIKALVAAYCRGVDAVDGYLRNSLSAYRASVKNQQWISVKDRLPDIYQRVLILIRGRVFISSIEEEYGDEYRDGVIRFWDGDWDWPEVTHWQPLPAPPKEEK